jgi:hypothetical protein
VPTDDRATTYSRWRALPPTSSNHRARHRHRHRHWHRRPQSHRPGESRGSIPSKSVAAWHRGWSALSQGSVNWMYHPVPPNSSIPRDSSTLRLNSDTSACVRTVSVAASRSSTVPLPKPELSVKVISDVTVIKICRLLCAMDATHEAWKIDGRTKLRGKEVSD